MSAEDGLPKLEDRPVIRFGAGFEQVEHAKI